MLDNTRIENLSTKKALKALLRESTRDTPLRSPLFKTIVMDLDRIMRSNHTAKKIDFSYSELPSQFSLVGMQPPLSGNQLNLNDIRIHFKQQPKPAVDNSALSTGHSDNSISSERDTYILGKQNISRSKRVLRIGPFVEAMLKESKEPERFRQKML